MSKYKPIGRKSINGVYKVVFSKEKSRKQYVMYNDRYIKLENYKKIMNAKAKARKQKKKIIKKTIKAKKVVRRKRGGEDDRFLVHQYSPSQNRGTARNLYGGLSPVPGFSYKHALPVEMKPIYAYNTSGLSPSQGGKTKKGGNEVKTLENSSPVLGYSTSGIVPYQVLPFPKQGGKKTKGGVRVENYPGKSIILQPYQYNHAVPGGKSMRGGTVPTPGTIPQLSNYRKSELYISQPETAISAPSSLIPFSDVFKMASIGGSKKSKKVKKYTSKKNKI